MEDYTQKYKGEQVELALFGGEFQDGVLTAYCLVDEVPHVELNGHILVPLQNVASLHCSSRCDAPDDQHWPAGRSRRDDDYDEPRPARPRGPATCSLIVAMWPASLYATRRQPSSRTSIVVSDAFGPAASRRRPSPSSATACAARRADRAAVGHDRRRGRSSRSGSRSR